MGKKKREHVVFDRMLQPKKSMPLRLFNCKSHTRQEAKYDIQRTQQRDSH